MYNTPEPVMRWCKDERGVSRESPAGGQRRRGVVAAEHRFLRTGRCRPSEWTRRTEDSCMRWCERGFHTCPSTPTTSRRRPRALELLILPNVAALSDAQCASIRAIRRTRRLSVRDRAAPACTTNGAIRGRISHSPICSARTRRRDAQAARRQRAAPGRGGPLTPDGHTYLRLSPELRRAWMGRRPATNRPSPARGTLCCKGFEETDILPYGGTLPAANRSPAPWCR